VYEADIGISLQQFRLAKEEFFTSHTGTIFKVRFIASNRRRIKTGYHLAAFHTKYCLSECRNDPTFK
jgi:hypothetical protein